MQRVQSSFHLHQMCCTHACSFPASVGSVVGVGATTVATLLFYVGVVDTIFDIPNTCLLIAALHKGIDFLPQFVFVASI